MSRPRPPTRDGSLHRPLKVVASGTLFLTHTLGLPTHVSSGAVIRAHSVAHARGGAASTALSILAQFPGVDALLVAPLGGNEEGRVVLQQLQRENVSTKYCKVWENAGVPSAWVMQAGKLSIFLLKVSIVSCMAGMHVGLRRRPFCYRAM